MPEGEYNAADAKQVKEARRTAKSRDERTRAVIAAIMAAPDGREWMFDLMARCGVFTSTFAATDRLTSFAEGRRSIGLDLLSQLTQADTLDLFTLMLKEHNDVQSQSRKMDAPTDGGGGRVAGSADDADTASGND
jgi:hypothetical protein